MILTERRMKEFFPEDNRFLHFVAKKHGLFFSSNDDVDTARYFAIVGVNRLLQGEFEFEDEIHLLGVVELNFKRGIFAMLSYNRAQKRSLDIRSESEFVMDGREDLTSHIERAQDETESDFKDELEYIKTISKESLNSQDNLILRLRLEGRSFREIGENIGRTAQRTRDKYESVIIKIKKIYEREKNRGTRGVNPPVSKVHVRKIQEGVRGRPATSHKADACDYLEVLSYLDIVQEV